MVGFIIFTLMVFIFVVMGVNTWRSNEAVGFFTGVEPPKIKEQYVKKYNHSVAVIWFVFSAILEIFGLPLLFFQQNSPYFIIPVLGIMFLVIGIIVAFLMVQNHFMKE